MHAEPPDTATIRRPPSLARGVPSSLLQLLYPALLALTAGALFLPISSEAKGLVGVALMLLMLASGLPVAVAMGAAGVIGIFALSGPASFGAALARLPYDSMSSWSLSVLPMFVLMGMLLWRSGSTDRLYSSAQKWLGWMPGGLAVTTNAAGAGLCVASGTTLGISYALGRIGLPAMFTAGYPTRLSVASVLMAGSGGALIPPSIMMVVYAGVAGTPVGMQLVAGIIPGTILAALYGLTLVGGGVVHRRRTGHRLDDMTGVTWAARFSSLKGVWPIPLLIVIVIGGIYTGRFTATEAGAVGAAFALGLVLWYKRRQGPAQVGRAASESVASIGAIFFLVVGAAILTRFLAMSGLTTSLAEAIQSWGPSRLQFLLMLVVFYIILGMFMEPISIVMLTVPVLLPVLPVVGIDPVWFGVFVVLMGEISIITPPVGLLLYVVYGLAQDDEVCVGREVPLGDVIKAASWLFPAIAVLLLIMIGFPDLVIVPSQGLGG